MSKRGSLHLHPGRALGPLYLGASIQDILDRLKSTPRDDQDIDLTYSSTDPTTTPVLISLPREGLRLRFDGPEQRLRLIEVLDFVKAPIIYNGHDVFKPTSAESFSEVPQGPSYRSLTKLLGPTFPGEYLSPHSDEDVKHGTYILSYPGVAFSFPVEASKWSPDPKNISNVMSSSATIATTMAIFEGRTWSEARGSLFKPTNMKLRARSSSSVDLNDRGDDLNLIKIYGEGRLELTRMSGTSFWITLSQTTAQDLVSELGAPDAIYHKNDRRLAIHESKRHSNTSAKGSSAVADDSEDDDPAMSLEDREAVSAEHFYNYLSLGIDVLISQPVQPSIPSPTVPESRTFTSDNPIHLPKNHLAATKIIIHGNVPGAWDFNRHRRCRWSLEHVPTAAKPGSITSEDKFSDISERLKEVFSSSYGTKEQAKTDQRGMALDRSWGASPDNSYELMGGWEEDMRNAKNDESGDLNGSLDTKSELFGFPGMIFEVLKNGAVNCLTVY